MLAGLSSVRDEIRTHTVLRPLPPQSSVSTNSTTRTKKCRLKRHLYFFKPLSRNRCSETIQKNGSAIVDFIEKSWLKNLNQDFRSVRDEIRTHTALRPLPPQSSVSTNSTTRTKCLSKRLLRILERKTGLEPATPTLARLCSTNWAIFALIALDRQVC